MDNPGNYKEDDKRNLKPIRKEGLTGDVEVWRKALWFHRLLWSRTKGRSKPATQSHRETWMTFLSLCSQRTEDRGRGHQVPLPQPRSWQVGRPPAGPASPSPNCPGSLGPAPRPPPTAQGAMVQQLLSSGPTTQGNPEGFTDLR